MYPPFGINYKATQLCQILTQGFFKRYTVMASLEKMGYNENRQQSNRLYNVNDASV